MSPDPYSGSYDGGNPQSFNRYTYALNRPASETDPTGEDGCGDDDDGTGASEGINGGYGWNPNASDAPSGYTLSGVNTSDGNPIYSDPSGNQFVAQAGMPTVQISPNNNESVSVNSSNSGFSSLGLAFYTSSGYGQSGNSGGGFASGGIMTTPIGHVSNSEQVPVHGPWHYGHFCGEGGMGTPVNSTDAACQQHDHCFDNLHLTGEQYTGGDLSPAQVQGAGACNQQLCNSALNTNRKTSTPLHQRWAGAEIILFFTLTGPNGAQCHGF